MFFIRRAVIGIGRNSIRHNSRFYCNAAKQFKQQNAKAVATKPLSTSNNDNERNGHETENDENNSKQNNEDIQRNIMLRGNFDQLTTKNRDTFVSMLHMFIERDKHRRHHVEFIYAALKQMKEFGVERDLEVYKEVLNVFPKGKFIPTNMFQAEFMHYPKQQDCAIFLLDQMEYNGSFFFLSSKNYQYILLSSIK